MASTGEQKLAKTFNKKKGGRQTLKTDLPHGASSWPTIEPKDTLLMLEMLVRLLQPIGHHRSTNPLPSAVKRARKRKRELPSASVNADSSTTTTSTSSPPAIAQHVIVGINSITRHLEHQLHHQEIRSHADIPELTVIFTPCSPTTRVPLQFQHLPVLVQMLQPPVSLVQLPAAAETQLARALGIARVQAVGIFEANDTEPLTELCHNTVPEMKIGWLEETKWQGTRIIVEEG